MCNPITPEEWQRTLEHFCDQTEQLLNGPQDLANAKFRCGCHRWEKLVYGYRCLYCEILFCKECAELHFGQTVAEYRQQNPVQSNEVTG